MQKMRRILIVGDFKDESPKSIRMQPRTWGKGLLRLGHDVQRFSFYGNKIITTGEGNRPPSFLKIDVEGAEADVLEGAANTLKNYQPMVLCETHGQTRAQRVYEILVGLNYELFCVKENVVPIESITQVPTNMYDGHLFARPKKAQRNAVI